MAHRIPAPWLAALAALTMTASASAQGDFMTLPLVHSPDQSVIILTYDAAVLPQVDHQPINLICSPQAPCQDTTLIIDTPLWRDEPEEISLFQEDLQRLLEVANDHGAFLQEPTIAFQSFGASASTPTQEIYESLIWEEAEDADLTVSVEWPE